MESIVYLAVNSVNGKKYIGRTSRPLKKRWGAHVTESCHPDRAGSRYAFHRAIKKYGKEAFLLSILQECSSLEESKSAEMSWIAKLGSLVPGGYNMTLGGEGALGFRFSPEAKERLRQIAIGQGRRPSPIAIQKAVETKKSKAWPHSPETIAKLTAAAQGRVPSQACLEARKASKIGHKLSEETKAKIRAKAIGRKHSEETKAKLSAVTSVENLSPEVRQRKSEAAKKRIATHGNPSTGRPVSADTRARMSESAKRRTILRGSDGRILSKSPATSLEAVQLPTENTTS
jgi:group I intron endonuclease